LIAIWLIGLLAACGGLGSPGDHQIQVQIDPSEISLAPEASQEFTVTVSGSDDDMVEWSATGGSIDGVGATVSYQAPAEPGGYTLTVTSTVDTSKSASALITVVDGSDGPSGARIEIISGSEVLLTGAGESTTLVAVVYQQDGTIDPDAHVTWESDDPDSVAVDTDGVATAFVDAGYANVSAHAAGLEPAVVSVAVAVPLAGTRIVDASKVVDLDVDASRVRMERSAETEAIEVGDVLVSNVGLLAHVLAVTVSDDEVEVEFEVGNLSDAFERVKFSSSTGPVIIDTVITDAGVSVQTSTVDGDDLGTSAFGIDALECKNELGRPITVKFTASEFNTNILDIQDRFEAVFAYDSADEDVFQAYVSDNTRISMKLGKIEMAVGGGVQATCKVEIGNFMVPVASFWGMVSVGGSVTPSIGIEAEAKYEGAHLAIDGPSLEAGVTFTAGVSYNKRTGEWSQLSSIDEHFDAEWPRLDGQLDHSLSFYVGPFFEAKFGVDLAIPGFSLAGVDVVKPKLSVGVSAGVPLLDRYSANYSGPSLDLRADLGADVGLELSGGLDRILRFMGIKAKVKLADFTVYAESFDLLPRPEVTVEPMLGSGSYPLYASVPLSPAFKVQLSYGSTLEFLAFADGDPIGTVVGTATIDKFGVAQTEWVPGAGASTLSSAGLRGDVRVVALLYDPVFGSLDLPIRSENTVKLFVPEAGAPPVVEAPLVGDVRTDGTFSTDGGVFYITLSPRDGEGNLIAEGVTIDSFAFRDIEVAPASSPDTIVAAATATITDVEIRQPTEGEAVRLVLDFDTSGSMSGNDPSRLSIKAGKDIVDLLRPGDRAAVVEFGGSTARVVQGLTDDRNLLKQTIDSLSFGGMTPLYDSIWRSLDLLDAAGASNPAIVILADGANNQAPYDFDAIVTRANAQGVPLFTVGLGSAAAHGQLQDFAALTGGVYAEAVDAGALEQLFEAIGFGIIQGRVIVSAEGLFQPRLTNPGEYVVNGVLETTIGGSTVDTPFSFSVPVE